MEVSDVDGIGSFLLALALPLPWASLVLLVDCSCGAGGGVDNLSFLTGGTGV